MGNLFLTRSILGQSAQPTTAAGSFYADLPINYRTMVQNNQELLAHIAYSFTHLCASLACSAALICLLINSQTYSWACGKRVFSMIQHEHINFTKFQSIVCRKTMRHTLCINQRCFFLPILLLAAISCLLIGKTFWSDLPKNCFNLMKLCLAKHEFKL